MEMRLNILRAFITIVMFCLCIFYLFHYIRSVRKDKKREKKDEVYMAFKFLLPYTYLLEKLNGKNTPDFEKKIIEILEDKTG